MKHEAWLPDSQQTTLTMTCFMMDLFVLNFTCNPSSWQQFQQTENVLSHPAHPVLSRSHRAHLLSSIRTLFTPGKGTVLSSPKNTTSTGALVKPATEAWEFRCELLKQAQYQSHIMMMITWYLFLPSDISFFVQYIFCSRL